MQQADKKDGNEARIGSPNTPDDFVEGAGIDLVDVRVGHALEAASFDGKWYYGKIVYVDESDSTFLVHFDGWNTRFDEWYKYASKKVRPLPPNADQIRKKTVVFKPGENVLAKWIDNKFYMCHVVRTRPGDKYEVRFEDGVLYTVEASKIRNADKIDEITESTRLLKQQEAIDRAKSRDIRLQRRSKIHNDTTLSLPSLDTPTHSVLLSEVVELEEGLRLPVSVPLSEVYLNSCERDENTPDLSVYRGNTYSVRSFSTVLGADLLHLAEADSDVTSTAPPTVSSAVEHTQEPDRVATLPVSVSIESTEPQLLPLTHTSPPLLPTYTPSLPYTETVVTADGRVLTLTPSYQPAPPPAPAADVTNQPLYYQLVPIQVNPSNSASSIPVEQSYLTVPQQYSYPYQTQYAPVVQQYPLAPSLPANPLPQDTAYTTQMHTMDILPTSSYIEQQQVYQSAKSVPATSDVIPHSDPSAEQADCVISDSESDKVLFIDTQPAVQRPDVTTPRTSRTSLSEEESEPREVRKLRLPDHNRKVAPRELVTTLKTELFACTRAGCKKAFHRRESLKKHLRVFHGSSALPSKQKVTEEPRNKLSPVCSPVSTPEPLSDPAPPLFPTSGDHSITHTELLFHNPPVSSHRSKRKSSQPRKSSFPEPATPTVTIVIPSDLVEAESPHNSPVNKAATVPSRQSKRISIRKNLDYDSNYKSVRKTGKLKDKLDRQDALKKDVRAQMSNPKLQLEMRGKAVLKMRPPQQQVEVLSDTAEPNETTDHTTHEIVSHDTGRDDICDVTDLVRDTDTTEPVESVEEVHTEMIHSPVEIVDIMEASDTRQTVTENPSIDAEVASESNKERYYSSGSDLDDEISTETSTVNAQEQIKCVCEQDKDEGVMVQCEQCMTWQHTSCLGLNERDLPDQHICSECSDPPACIKREQYKHCNPWYRSGKIMFPTDTDLVETGAHLNSLKNQLAALENILPSVNLKIQIAREGSHPYLKEFLSDKCSVLTKTQIEDRVSSLSYLTDEQTDVSEKLMDCSDKVDTSVVRSDTESTEVVLEPETAQTILQPQTDVEAESQVTEVDPNLISLMLALNDSDWGCEMRLFDDVEKIQNDILGQFSSIEKKINCLRYRIPDSDVSSLSDTLSKLDAIRTSLS